MSKYRNIKMKVHNSAQSEAVQRFLIDHHGCDWPTGGKVTKYTEAPHLYVGASGALSYGEEEEYFATNTGHVEVDPRYSWVFSVSIPEPKEREVVMYNGKKYYADVLEKVLEGLEVK